MINLLILCPGTIPNKVEDIKCFTDVLCYYLPRSLSQIPDLAVTLKSIPAQDGPELQKTFATLDVENCDVILTTGLRFYSKVSLDTVRILRDRYHGLLCQIHDGTRLDYDPVDVTFTIKNDDVRLADNEKRYQRHTQQNEYLGWATDFSINTPKQDPKNLRILIDHTNYGDNQEDSSIETIKEVQRLIKSEIWKTKYDSVTVRRFITGGVEDVAFDNLDIGKYERSMPVPYSEISKEHCLTHIFCVTHPESVGLVVLETAAAGALVVTPRGYIAKDRLETVRHIEWSDQIDWVTVMDSIDITASRNKALENSWDSAALRCYSVLKRRIKGNAND